MPNLTCPKCGKDIVVPSVAGKAFVDSPIHIRAKSEDVSHLPSHDSAISVQNLLSPLPSNLQDEFVEPLITGKSVRIERIVSMGQASPPGFWYEQDEAEWVVVLHGEAKLLFEGETPPIHLKPGDHVTIPPHIKHRVEWTSPTDPTVWLAVFHGK